MQTNRYILSGRSPVFYFKVIMFYYRPSHVKTFNMIDISSYTKHLKALVNRELKLKFLDELINTLKQKLC